MLASSIPTKFQVPFAASAGVGYITEPVPYAPGSPGRASLQQGFPPTAFVPSASGGIPPWGADMNGILNQATAWLQWAQAGGIPLIYDATFSSEIGGYPQGAFLIAATIGNGKFWISTVDNNTSNPDTGGANWLAFPDLPIQKQNPNYAVDNGTTNAYVVTLSPLTPFASLVGAPIRFKAGSTNSVTNPTIILNGSTAATMINSDGTVLGVGQISSGNIVEGIPRDDGKFQVNSPIKAATAATAFVTGCIYIWPNETPPTGTLECNGQTVLIASYPGLYAVIGTRYGGNGSTNFIVPDLRGEFIRGWDHGRGLDPNSATRTNAGGGATGDHVGTNQTASVKASDLGTVTASSINPSLAHHVGSQLGGSTGDTIAAYDDVTGFAFILNGTGAETRPINIYMMYVIAI